MAEYQEILDTEVEPEAPLTSSLGVRFRDNPVAIAEGAAGAPRVASESAIDWGGGGTGTSASQDWVLGRISDASVGAVGTYAFLRVNPGVPGSPSPGEEISGSSLRYYGVSDTDEEIGDSPAGTWRSMGQGGRGMGTLWLRIS